MISNEGEHERSKDYKGPDGYREEKCALLAAGYCRSCHKWVCSIHRVARHELHTWRS